jgi:hypothetical protein
MYRYALEHGFITDEDAYLTSITERQDICLNMTLMKDEDITRVINESAAKANKILELGLDDKHLLKTGGYKGHTNRDKQLNNDDPLKRNENDFSFNYSSSVFSESEGGRRPSERVSPEE